MQQISTQQLFLEIKQKILNSESGGIVRILRLTNKNITDDVLEEIFNDPQCFEKLKEIRCLDLSENKITKLPERIWELTNLTSLAVSHNQIEEISNNIGNLKQLEFLHLNNNKIKTLPENIDQLEALNELNLHVNIIEKLSENICKLTNLIFLNISHNPIERLPENICKLTNLKYINLYNTKVKEVPKEFANIPIRINFNYDNLDNQNAKFYIPTFGEINNKMTADAVMDALDLTQYKQRFLTNTELGIRFRNFLEMLSAIPFFDARKEYIKVVLKDMFDGLNSEDRQIVKDAAEFRYSLDLRYSTGILHEIEKRYVKLQKEKNQTIPRDMLYRHNLGRHADTTDTKALYNPEEFYAFLNMMFLKDIENIVRESSIIEQNKKDMILKYIPKNRDERLFQHSATGYVDFGVNLLFSNDKTKINNIFKEICVLNRDGELKIPVEIDYRKLDNILNENRYSNDLKIALVRMLYFNNTQSVIIKDQKEENNKLFSIKNLQYFRNDTLNANECGIRRFLLSVDRIIQESKINSVDTPDWWGELKKKNEFWGIMCSGLPYHECVEKIYQISKGDLPEFFQKYNLQQLKKDINAVTAKLRQPDADSQKPDAYSEKVWIPRLQPKGDSLPSLTLKEYLNELKRLHPSGVIKNKRIFYSAWRTGDSIQKLMAIELKNALSQGQKKSVSSEDIQRISKYSFTIKRLETAYEKILNKHQQKSMPVNNTQSRSSLYELPN